MKIIGNIKTAGISRVGGSHSRMDLNLWQLGPAKLPFVTLPGHDSLCEHNNDADSSFPVSLSFWDDQEQTFSQQFPNYFWMKRIYDFFRRRTVKVGRILPNLVLSWDRNLNSLLVEERSQGIEYRNGCKNKLRARGQVNVLKIKCGRLVVYNKTGARDEISPPLRPIILNPLGSHLPLHFIFFPVAQARNHESSFDKSL